MSGNVSTEIIIIFTVAVGGVYQPPPPPPPPPPPENPLPLEPEEVDGGVEAEEIRLVMLPRLLLNAPMDANCNELLM